MNYPNVAFFADSFHEVNGVALTSRQLEAFARRSRRPLLSVHAADAASFRVEDPVWSLELERTAVALPLERDMSFDLLFLRHKARVAQIVRSFRADLVHITGPSDVGILGAWIAHQLGLPLVASWHTNLHEFGARRLEKFLGMLPESSRRTAAGATERGILESCARFYRLARVLMAPNEELCRLLEQRTGRPCFLMKRGADTTLFHPARRTRTDGLFTLGYVGRVTPEKNVRFLKAIEERLLSGGVANFRFLIVGDGSEREWLREHMAHADLPGVLKGEKLAEAYANMDLFVFPSETDTYGNVVQEAMASAVPAIVTAGGGPKFLVNDGVTGFVCATGAEFLDRTLEVVRDRARHRQMSYAAREHALTLSWDRTFEDVWSVYRRALEPQALFARAV